MSNPTTVAAVKHITNMDNHIAYGYTPSKGCLYGQSNETGQSTVQTSPIFNITYNNQSNNTFNWGPTQDEAYAYPDQVSGPPMVKDSGFSTSDSIVVDSIYKWREKIAASLSGSFHGVVDDISGSGSASVSGMYGTSIFDHMHSEYFMDFYIQELLTFSVDMDQLKTSMTQGFQNDLGALQADLSSPANRQAYIHFLAKYGTHILTSGTYGGTYRMESAVQKTLIQNTQNIQIKTKMHTAFSMGLDGGSMSASAAYNSSTFMSDYKDQISIHTYLQGANDGTATQTKGTWVTGLYGTPYLVYATPGIPTGAGQSTPSQMLQISNLASGQIATNLEEMIKVYMRMPLFSNGNLISEPVSIPAQQNMTANGYCMLSAYAKSEANIAVTSISSTGTALSTQITSSLNFVASARALKTACVTFPAGKGTDFGYSLSDTSGTIKSNADVYALLNLPPSQVTASTLTPINILDQSEFTPPSDGFIMATVDNNGQNAVSGQVFLHKQGGANCAAATQHYWVEAGKNNIEISANSFTFPVMANETYVIHTNTISGSPTYSACFLPLDSRLSLGDLQLVENANFGTSSPAGTDGFLAVLINASGENGNGCMAQVNLKSGSQPDQMITRSSCSAQFQFTENTNVQWNSALLPIPKGWNYEVEVVNNVSNLATISAFWIPLTAST